MNLLLPSEQSFNPHLVGFVYKENDKQDNNIHVFEHGFYLITTSDFKTYSFYKKNKLGEWHIYKMPNKEYKDIKIKDHLEGIKTLEDILFFRTSVKKPKESFDPIKCGFVLKDTRDNVWIKDKFMIIKHSEDNLYTFFVYNDEGAYLRITPRQLKITNHLEGLVSIKTLLHF